MYFPMFVDLARKPCLVFGGGRVALRKIRTLLRFEADVYVRANEFCDALSKMLAQGKIKEWMGSDSIIESFEADRFSLVICATDDQELNHRISTICRQKKIPVNSATDESDSTFIFPAVVTRGDLTVGVTTSGKSPSLSAAVREQIDDLLPEWYADLLEQLHALRALAKDTFDNPGQRKIFMNRMTQIGIENEGEIPKKTITEIIDEIIESKLI